MIQTYRVTGSVDRLKESFPIDDVRQERGNVILSCEPSLGFELAVPLEIRITELPLQHNGFLEPWTSTRILKGKALISEPVAMRLDYRMRRAGFDSTFLVFSEYTDRPEADIVVRTLVGYWSMPTLDSETFLPLLEGLDSCTVTARFNYRQFVLCCPPKMGLKEFFKRTIIDTRKEWCASEGIDVRYSEEIDGGQVDPYGDVIISHWEFDSLEDAAAFELAWGCGLQHFPYPMVSQRNR